jgi:tetratricopeptide (TPR) repeat protein
MGGKSVELLVLHTSSNRHPMTQPITRSILVSILLPIMSTAALGQNEGAADKLVDEGIVLHDKGDYSGAIAKYDQALLVDVNNPVAMTEKAMSLFSLKRHNKSIEFCEKTIAQHPGTATPKSLYVTYGNALDILQKHEKSIEVYNQGIQIFPDFYQLYYNKGVTLSGLNRREEAMKCFQKAALLNPQPGFTKCHWKIFANGWQKNTCAFSAVQISDFGTSERQGS